MNEDTVTKDYAELPADPAETRDSKDISNQRLAFMGILGVAACACLIFYMGYTVGYGEARIDAVNYRIEQGYEDNQKESERRLIVIEILQELRIQGVIK
jgi:hypothetical protein